MPHRFPSEDWTSAYRDAVNKNDAYRKAARPWTFGSVAMVINAEPGIGIEDDTGMILDVHQGECRGTTYVKGMERVREADTAFVIVADYNRWKEVIRGKLDPIKGMMEGKLKLTKGHLPTMIRFVEASRELVVSASKVPTEFVG